MRPRDPHEPGRTASTLELFFDLVFVIAVSNAASNFHHLLAEDHIGTGLLAYLMVFLGIWWAWMNFTWFATSFDTDDWLYRVLTVLQMSGVLVLAAGIEPVFHDFDMRVFILGYVIMRVAMVLQWLRAGRIPGPEGRTARTYALGITTVQVLWIAALLLPSGPPQLLAFGLLYVAEVSVPPVAEHRGGTPWHPHHITERYGLFTLIVLGESLLGSSNALIESLHEREHLGELIVIAALTLVVAAGLWWIYFWTPHHRSISTFSRSMLYGYVHYFVFAAAAAFSAGIEAEIDLITGHSELGSITTSLTVAIPIMVFVLGIWWISMRAQADAVVNTAIPLGALLILVCALLPFPTALIAVVMVGMVVVLVVRDPIPEGENPLPRYEGPAGSQG